MISLNSVSKIFNRDVVLSRISLTLKEGELFVLLGKSGSGKSTLLRAIAGLETIDSGSIFIDNKEVSKLPPQKRNVGMVFQSYALFPNQTVFQNITYGLKIRGVSSSSRHIKGRELISAVGLTGLEDRLPHKLSGGQKQRVALARAMAIDPKVLLLDEPLGALDPQIRGEVRAELKAFQRKLGVTTIMVTHDREEACELADRIGIIDSGHLMEVGTPEELYNSPKSVAAASLLGGGVILAGRVKETLACFGELSIPVSKDEYVEGGPVRLLIRPESVNIERKGVSLGRCLIEDQTYIGGKYKVNATAPSLQGSRVVGQRALKKGDSPSIYFFSNERISSEATELFLSSTPILSPATLSLICVSSEETIKLARSITAKTKGRIGFIGSPLPQDLLARESRISPSRDNLIEEIQHGMFELALVAKKEISIAKEVLGELPVMLVDDNSETEINNILLPTAGGTSSKESILFAGRLARLLGAKVSIINISQERNVYVETLLESASSTLKAMKVPSTGKVLSGDPVKAIQKEILQTKPDLVILGSSEGEDPMRVPLEIIGKLNVKTIILPRDLEIY
jgi:putative spermidine/putrescine transport system ATP-binding protein